MIQNLYDYPLPNDGDGYKLNKDELIALLDAAYKNGFNAAKSSETVKTYTTEEPIFCNRCGKKITSNEYKILTTYNIDGREERSLWCEDCANSFKKDMETPVKSFTDIKPAIYKDYSKEIKRWTEIVKNRQNEKYETKGEK